jgi:hypothetical protein
VGLVVAWGVALASCVCLPAGAWAQGSKAKKGADSGHKTGTVAQVEKKGKTATLTIEESDGEKLDILVTAKTNFLVKGRGDATFFKHSNVSVSADEIVMNAGNKYLFGKKFTIHLGNKPPAEVFEPNPMNPSVYHIAGPVVDCAEDSFTFEAAGTQYKVGFEQNVVPEISVESTEPEHAVVGAAVEVDGTANKGGKFNPTAIVVTLEKAMVADDVFGAGDKKSGKSKSSKSAKKNMTKSDKGSKDKTDKSADKGEDAAAGEPVKTGDPFGVLDNKDGKKGKAAPKKDKKPAPKAGESDN